MRNKWAIVVVSVLCAWAWLATAQQQDIRKGGGSGGGVDTNTFNNYTNYVRTNYTVTAVAAGTNGIQAVTNGGVVTISYTNTAAAAALAWNFVKVTNQVTTTSTTFAALTNMTLGITNSSNSKSVKVSVTASLGGNASGSVQWRIMRVASGATNECWPLASTPANYTSMLQIYNANADSVFPYSVVFIDTPGTNRPTYYVEWKAQTGTVSFNQSVNNTASQPYSLKCSSNMVLEELP